jgi:hypothetical protein
MTWIDVRATETAEGVIMSRDGGTESMLLHGRQALDADGCPVAHRGQAVTSKVGVNKGTLDANLECSGYPRTSCGGFGF